MSKKTFVKGAVILGVAGLIVQVMGAVFRIPLANIIGSEGMGYYQTVYPIYIFLLVFSTNGAPAAISKMTSDRIAVGNYFEAHRVFKLAFVVMFVFGIVAFFAFLYGGNLMISRGRWQGGTYYSILAIAPALFFVPIMSVFRGYFQGMQEMTPTALSQFSEQLVRVTVGLTLALLFYKSSIEIAAAGASLGTSVGPVVGTLVILIIYLRSKRKWGGQITQNATKTRESSASIIKTIARIAIPITIGVSILPIMNVVDTYVVQHQLIAIGYDPDTALALYGELSGMAGAIINIPQALALSMALSIVPAIAAAKSRGDTPFLNMNVSLSLRTSFVIGVPCMFGLMILAEPIITLLYRDPDINVQNVTGCLFYLASGIVFLAVALTMAGVLQGLGKPGATVLTLGVAVLVKAIVTYVLTGMPELNAQGAAIGSSIAYLVVGILNFLVVKKHTSAKFNISLSIVKPVLSGIIMSIFVLISYYALYQIIGNSLACVVSIVVGGIVYMISLLQLKAITADEIKMLPKGGKLLSLLRKLRMVK